jgi:outer membrane protein OmpA-like peptidoglycan-associated protein
VLHFRSASATLDVGQDEALDALAALFKRCPDGRVLVHGLRESPAGPALPAASSPGRDGALVMSAASAAQVGGGLLLAQRRAQAVRAELVARGIALTRVQLGAGAREVAGETPARVELTLAPAPRS